MKMIRNGAKGCYSIYQQMDKFDRFILTMRVNKQLATRTVKVEPEDDIQIKARQVMEEYMDNIDTSFIPISREEYPEIVDRIATTGRYGTTYHSPRHMKIIIKMLIQAKIHFYIDENDFMIYNTDVYDVTPILYNKEPFKRPTRRT